jgi:hypothetical protein
MIKRSASLKTMKNKLQLIEVRMVKVKMALQVWILTYLNRKMEAKTRRKSRYLSDHAKDGKEITIKKNKLIIKNTQ